MAVVAVAEPSSEKVADLRFMLPDVSLRRDRIAKVSDHEGEEGEEEAEKCDAGSEVLDYKNPDSDSNLQSYCQSM